MVNYRLLIMRKKNKRPSISDQIRVGFFSTDRCTQTNETEIIVLKTATENLQSMAKVSEQNEEI